MDQHDVDLLGSNPDWRQVLLAYRSALEAPAGADEQLGELIAKGFRPRVREVDGIQPELISRIHGKLIAHGFLQVEIADRTGGMLYQLTQAGRRACVQLWNVSDVDSEVDSNSHATIS